MTCLLGAVAHDGEQKSIGAADTCDFEKEDLASEPDSVDMMPSTSMSWTPARSTTLTTPMIAAR